MTNDDTFEAVVRSATEQFGASVTPRLAGPIGEPEDQLRGPLENFIDTIGAALGLSVEKFGEATLSELRVRPDYAIQVDGAINGYLEVKAPGKGASTSAFRGHDRKQWLHLADLPNVLYTDGNSWALYRSGVEVGAARLNGDVRSSGSSLRPTSADLANLLHNFLHWEPIPPTSVAALVQSVAGMCRLLRTEILDALAREHGLSEPGPLSAIASDWRNLLFPMATDEQFADGYAQAVTFGLLLARVERIDFSKRSVVEIANQLGKEHSLMGKALSVLTDDSVGDIRVTIDTMLRVIGVVDWQKLEKNDDTLLHLYEHFLAIYDPALRKKTGSYYTPNEVVAGMVRLAAQSLRDDLGVAKDFLSDTVVIADPAMGTGTFLLNIISNAALTAAAEEGSGAVGPQLEQLAPRLIGFERQVGPFAVAELRAYEALRREEAAIPSDSLRLFVADTLDNPYVEDVQLGAGYEPIARSRRSANAVKKDERVVVVIGNPPYGAQAAGQGGWVELGDHERHRRPLLQDFMPEPEDDAAPHVRHLYNQYVFFWRWATWKVFEAQGDDVPGLVCFITSSGWLAGAGFVAMRRRLIAQCDAIWVIDLEGGGLNTVKTDNIFDIQTPVAVVMAVRYGASNANQAHVNYTKISGTRAEKLAVMGGLQSRSDLSWMQVENAVDSFIPRDVVWGEVPIVHDLFPWFGVGVTAGRTWVMGPDKEILDERFRALIAAERDTKSELLAPHNPDRTIDSKVAPLPGFADKSAITLANESVPTSEIVRFGRRSFDRQWIIADKRVLNRPNPGFWEAHSDKQVYLATNKRHPIGRGPGVTFSAYPPDNGYFRAAGGEYALPLWRDQAATAPNVAPGLLELLADRYGFAVSGPDLFAYAAGIASHRGYYDGFESELTEAGIRVPITSVGSLWSEVVEVGRRVISLHTFGERFRGPSDPAGCPKLPEDRRPLVVDAISSKLGELPEEIRYNRADEMLVIGSGRIGPVAEEVWLYQISSMPVVAHWFGYRKRVPSGRKSSPLDSMQAEQWTATRTTELLELLNVLALLIDLEPIQEALMHRVVRDGYIDASGTLADLIPPPGNVRGPIERTSEPTLPI